MFAAMCEVPDLHGHVGSPASMGNPNKTSAITTEAFGFERGRIAMRSAGRTARKVIKAKHLAFNGMTARSAALRKV